MLRLHLLATFALLLIFSATQAQTYSRNGMVVSSNFIASDVGIQILEAGGNAIDASIATTFTLTITNIGELKSTGTIKITTLWDNTTHTTLNYTGEAQFNGSTGYTTVNGTGQGTMIYDFNKKKHIVANVNMSLKPGMIEGEVTITGFGEDMPCRLIKMEINDFPR